MSAQERSVHSKNRASSLRYALWELAESDRALRNSSTRSDRKSEGGTGSRSGAGVEFKEIRRMGGRESEECISSIVSFDRIILSTEIINAMLKAGKRIQLAQKPSRVSQQDAISSVPSALRYQSVKEVSKRSSLDRTDVKQIFGISESTQFRYEKQNPILKSAIADRLERFKRICQQALELFEDEAETQRWLSSPKVTLGGQTPLSALSTDAGAKKVEETLYQAEYGMFG